MEEQNANWRSQIEKMHIILTDRDNQLAFIKSENERIVGDNR